MASAKQTKIPEGALVAGKFRIIREIGRGGMATVYEADHFDLDKRVALKVLAASLAGSTIIVERFLREARAAAAIRSPYVCEIYDSGHLDDGHPYLVLELLRGQSLYERTYALGQLDIETTVAIATHVARGLARAHEASIVHRDLKPENIFLTSDARGRLLAKVLDFGLAKFYEPEGVNELRITREGAVFGTPAYMSPEQVRGQSAADHRADLWALGCIVYETLTGRTVWPTNNGVVMTFAQIAKGDLPRPSEHRAELPRAFDAWFERALHRDIDRRFQNAMDLATALREALLPGARTALSEAPPPPERDKLPTLPLGAGAAPPPRRRSTIELEDSDVTMMEEPPTPTPPLALSTAKVAERIPPARRRWQRWMVVAALGFSLMFVACVFGEVLRARATEPAVAPAPWRLLGARVR